MYRPLFQVTLLALWSCMLASAGHAQQPVNEIKSQAREQFSTSSLDAPSDARDDENLTAKSSVLFSERHATTAFLRAPPPVSSRDSSSTRFRAQKRFVHAAIGGIVGAAIGTGLGIYWRAGNPGIAYSAGWGAIAGVIIGAFWPVH